MAMAESVVRNIIRDPLVHDGWTIQGLGMLRLELTPDGSERLHIWDPATTLNDTTSAHDHPWDIIESQVYFGSMGNQRYAIAATNGVPMRAATVVCGIGSHLIEPPKPVLVAPTQPFEQYAAGDSYAMQADEFHESYPTPGTVTVIKRHASSDKNTATICWAGDGDWKEEGFTRNATLDEILHFVSLANFEIDASDS